MTSAAEKQRMRDDINAVDAPITFLECDADGVANSGVIIESPAGTLDVTLGLGNSKAIFRLSKGLGKGKELKFKAKGGRYAVVKGKGNE